MQDPAYISAFMSPQGHTHPPHKNTVTAATYVQYVPLVEPRPVVVRTKHVSTHTLCGPALRERSDKNDIIGTVIAILVEIGTK